MPAKRVRLNSMRSSISIHKTLGLAGIFALAGVALLADNVKTDYDKNADFSRVHTYSWGQVKTSNELYQSRIKQAVDKDLQAKGWQMVESGGDATIFATGQVHNQTELQTTYDSFGPGWGGGWGWGGWGWGMGGGIGEASTTTTQQPVAHLVLDIFSSNDKKLMFRAVITRDVSDKSDKNVRSLDKDIEKALKDFPPKGK